MNRNQIFLELKELLNNSYCPYSNYPVASLVETENGFVKGVNVENGSYGLTICAERSALVSAISQGNKQLKNIYLITKDNNNTGTPCGACRQCIAELIANDGKIVVFNYDGTYNEYSKEELIPFVWDPKQSL